MSKFVDHLPLHRIERMFQRLSLGLPRNVQCDWLLKVAENLLPLYQLLKQQALSGPRVWTDDTVIPIQNDIKKRKRTIQARLWVYIGGSLNDPPTVFYDFTRSRSQLGPLNILNGYQGYLHADAYPGYDRLYRQENINVAVIGLLSVARWRKAYFPEVDGMTLGIHKYIFNDEGVKTIGQYGHSFIMWEGIREIIETDDVILLMLDTASSWILPIHRYFCETKLLFNIKLYYPITPTKLLNYACIISA